MSGITKEGLMYDRRKVDVGDIITFNEYSLTLLGKEKFFHKRVAIVEEVEPTTLWIKTQDDYFTGELKGFGLPISRAEEIDVIYRSYHNVGMDENYGLVDAKEGK